MTETTIGWALVVALAFLFGIALMILVNAVRLNPLDFDTPGEFAEKVPELISDVLLIVILIELAETVRGQAFAHGSRRLSPGLVVRFLVIGIVAGIRHLLSVGAELSFPTPEASRAGETLLALRRSLMLELAINAVIVFLLVVVWWISHVVRNNFPGAE